MGTVAAGTGESGGGGRSTAPRRIVTLALGLVVTMVGMLGAPATVEAAAAWKREVRFGATEAEPQLVMEWTHGGPHTPATGLSGVCGIQGAWRNTLGFETTGAGTPNFGSSVGVAGGGGCRWNTSGTVTHYWAMPDGSHPIGSGNEYKVEVQWCGDAGKQVRVGRGTGAFGVSHTVAGYEATWNETNPQSSCQHGSATNQTDEVQFTLGAASSLLFDCIGGYCYWQRISVYLIAPGVEGSCEGIDGPGTDGGLTWGSAGITSTSHADGWGDLYSATAPPSDSCKFLSDGFFTYRPPEGVTKGETHTIGVEISSAPAVGARIAVQWGCLPNGLTYTIIDHSWHGSNPDGALGGGASIQKANAPADGACFRITALKGTFLHSLYLGNVEGDPLLDICDGGDDPPECSPGPDAGGDPSDPFGECEPGSDFLAVGEWVAYAACLIAGLPVAIAGFIAGVLRDLFVPTTLADTWSEFWDNLTGKVPFGWVVQAVTAVASVSTASGSAMDWSIDIGGYALAIPIAPLASAASPYRPVLAAIVVAGTALVVFRTVTGTKDEGTPA